MEEIEYKLSSNNPVLISHAISKLLETIKTKVKSVKNNDVSQVPEYKLLLSKYKNNNPVLSASICEAISILVKSEILSITSAMSTLISHLSVTDNYAPIIAAVGDLLILELKLNGSNKYVCSYSLQTPQHPFIILLNQKGYVWQPVLDQIQLILNHCDDQVKDNSLEMLRPVFLYILCNPLSQFSYECKQQIWKFLISSNNALELQTEILLWLCRNPINVCIDTNHRIIELVKICLEWKDTDYYTALLPLILSLTMQVLEYGYDPRTNYEIILANIDDCDDCIANMMIALLTEIILICPVAYLHDTLQICAVIIEKKVCNVLLLNTLIASILKWMAYPCLMSSNALILAKNLMDNILLEKKWSNSIDINNISKILLCLAHTDVNIQFYLEIIHCTNDYTVNNMLSWLDNVSEAPIDLMYKCKSILCGLFLESTDSRIIQKTCDILVQFAKEMNNFASHVLCLILYKLSKSHYNYDLKHLLTAIPELVVAKENIPIVIHVLEILGNSDKPLKYFAVELYLKALEKEPRCYRFLSTIISHMIKNDSSWYSSVTCARAMMSICETRSEHGEELVPLLTHILNHCTDVNGSTASAFALKSIMALCKSAVIGICSTWKGLAPMMKKEKRTIVLESLCEFFQYIPHCPYRQSEDHDKLIVDVITTLWTYAMCSDLKVANAALKALMSYRLDQTPLKALPAELKCNLVIPAAYTKNLPENSTKNPDDILPYIPGVCWIQLLQKINKTLLSSAGDVLIHYIKNELGTLRSGIYVWPQGEPNDYKYLPEKSVIRAIGEYLRRSKPDRENERIITECLRIFAYKYSKPLPNIKWEFLQKTAEISDRAKAYSLSIACSHATISLSARTFVEEYLSKCESNSNLMLENKEYLSIYSNLDSLCEVLQTTYLKPFLDVTLEYVLKKIAMGNEEALKLFEQIMYAYTDALKNDGINHGNRTLLSNNLELLLDQIDLTCGHFTPYIKAVCCLSSKEIERMVLPSVWWDVTPKKLRNAITVRTDIALDHDVEALSLWMNDAIDVTLSNPGVKTYFLERMQKVHSNMRFEKFSIDWTLNLLHRIQDILTEYSNEKYDQLIFYCDILFVSIISLSAVDCLLPNKNILTISQEVRARLFPQAINILIDRKFWKDILPQLMDWLDHMRTTPLPDLYKSALYSSLISLRHESYYQKMWTKYLSTRTSVYI